MARWQMAWKGLLTRPVFVALVVALCHLVVSVHRQQWPVIPLFLGLLVALALLARAEKISASLPLAYAPVFLTVLFGMGRGVAPAVMVFVIPMIYLVRRVSDWKSAFGYGVWIGGLIAVSALSWLWDVMSFFYEFSRAVTLLMYLFICLLMGLRFGVFMVLSVWLKRFGSLPLGLVVCLAYAVVEYWSPIPFSMQMATGTMGVPVAIQIADLVGMPGVSVVLALISGALFTLIDGLARRQRVLAVSGAVASVLLIGFVFGYGVYGLRHYAPPLDQPPVRVAVLQPMSPLMILNADHETKQAVARNLVAMSKDAATTSTGPLDLLVWPEGAAPFSYTTPEFNPEFPEAIREIQREVPVAMTFQDAEFAGRDEEQKVRYYNRIGLIGPDGSFLGGYRKMVPMPFTEYLPGESKFPWLRKLFPQVRRVVKGEHPTVLPGPQGPFAPLICYEILLPRLVRRFVNQGARYIINYTNDGFYGDTQQPYQHLGFAIFRAVENRRPVIRATNTGISALIDARGVIAPGARTGVMEKAILRGTIHPRDEKTLYARWGDWMPHWVLTPWFLFTVAYLVIRDRQRRRAAGSREAGSAESTRAEGSRPRKRSRKKSRSSL